MFAMQETPEMPAAAGGIGIVGLIIYVVILLVVVAGIWKVFAKAGEPGFAAIVPIWNLLVMVKIAGKPTWWVVLFFIPVANFIASIMVAIGIAERFGKSTGFGLGLERMLMYVTGMKNIRDVVPLPRTPGSAEF